MAQWTRDNFVTELQNRGWSRFATADLQKYLDFGLRDVMRDAKWIMRGHIIPFTSSASKVPFASIDSSDFRQVERLYLKTSGRERRLEPMTDDEFYQRWLPLDPTKNTGEPEKYYVRRDADGGFVYLKPAPNKTYSFEAHVVSTSTAFGGNNASPLPERFDEIILVAAEIYCFRRAREWEAMQVAKMEYREKILAELVEDGQLMEERQNRVVPHR